jgi:protein-disulfide isomerase
MSPPDLPVGPDGTHDPVASPSEPVAIAPEAATPTETPAMAEAVEAIDAAPTEPVRPVPADRGGLLRLAGYLVAAVAGAALVLAGLGVIGGIALPAASPSPSPAYMQGTALGDPAAPVIIEVWADYQCPYCGLEARGVEPSIERTLVEPGKARLLFRDFAFLGQESIDAAVAAQCAGRQGAYWYYHDLLFSSQQGENQGAFARESLLSLAGFAGLDQAPFTACLDDKAVAAAVETETKEGRTLGVESTPTMRITGPGGSELLTGVKPLSDVEAAVERMSKPAPSGGPATSPSPAASSGGTPAASPAAASPTASPSPSP